MGQVVDHLAIDPGDHPGRRDDQSAQGALQSFGDSDRCPCAGDALVEVSEQQHGERLVPGSEERAERGEVGEVVLPGHAVATTRADVGMTPRYADAQEANRPGGCAAGRGDETPGRKVGRAEPVDLIERPAAPEDDLAPPSSDAVARVGLERREALSEAYTARARRPLEVPGDGTDAVGSGGPHGAVVSTT